MLVLSREIGESVVIEDVVLTLVSVSEKYVEVSLVKMSGGKVTMATLPHDQTVEICYDVEVVVVNTKGPKVRLGFETPDDLTIRRGEFLDT